MWPEINQRINYPIKCVIVVLQAREAFDFDDAVTKFCVSWLTMYTCHDPLQQLVDSWNFYRIPGHNGCVLLENMLQSNQEVKRPEELVPSTEEVVRMYEDWNRTSSIAARSSRVTREVVSHKSANRIDNVFWHRARGH